MRFHMGIDVGGTNTRVCVVPSTAASSATDEAGRWTRTLSTASELGRFLREIVTELDASGRVSRVVLGVAGPVIDHREVTMTNWTSERQISVDDLRAWGLTDVRARIINDMEASAYGLMAAGPHIVRSRLALYEPAGSAAGPVGERTCAVLAPGTGLGTVTILTLGGAGGRTCTDCVPSELQHVGAAALDARHAALIEWRRRRRAGRWPTWEDFVSGAGLVESYRGLRALDGVATSPSLTEELGESPDQASVIAMRARATGAPDGDYCREALGLYYRCVGRVAQALALTVQPFGGIYLYGASTRHNLDFVRDCGLVAEIQRSDAQEALLRRFPVYVVTTDANLAGCVWVCRNRLDGDAHPETSQVPGTRGHGVGEGS